MRSSYFGGHRRLRFAGAVSSLAIIVSGCSSYAGDRRGSYDRPRGGDVYAAGYYDRSELNRSDHHTDTSNGGIAAARDAHSRYADYRAEQLDGDCERRVRIKRGETLSDLAEYCDVSVASIVEANPSIRDLRNIPIGAEFYIPDERGSVYQNAIFGRDHRYHSSREENARLLRRDIATDHYVVRRGDTLSDIAARENITLSEIRSVNPALRSRDLAIGERIYLPNYSRRSSDRRDIGSNLSLGRFRPAISFSPDRGPRNGEIRLVGDNFEGGEEVAVLYGDHRDRLLRIRTIEADQYGRISEIVRLPDSYRSDEAYFAMQRGDEIYVSETAYAFNAGDADGLTYGNSNFGNGAGLLQRPAAPSSSAVLRAVDREVYRNDTVTLSAVGFPANTPVSIYGGPNRDTLTKISEIRTGPSGVFEAEVEIPGNVQGDAVLFVAAVEDGARTFFTERVRVRTDELNELNRRRDIGGLSDSLSNDISSRPEFSGISAPSLDRGVDRGAYGGSTFLSRFRSLNQGGPININDGGRGAISGVLTNEGKRCPTLRDDSGAIFSLLGDLRSFSDGDRVLIRGSTAADKRICNQSETIQIFSIESAPW